MADCPHCRRYREQAEEAREELRQLRDLLARTNADMRADPAEWGLTHTEALVFGELYSLGSVSHSALQTLLYSDRNQADYPTSIDNILKVWVHKVRTKLPPGLAIKSVWAWGYQLRYSSLERFSEVMGLPVYQLPAWAQQRAAQAAALRDSTSGEAAFVAATAQDRP